MSGPLGLPSPGSLPQVSAWAQALQQIAGKSLDLCKDFPMIARRYEAWWSQDLIDRPVFIAAANTEPSRPITRRLELLDQPAAWFQSKLSDMLQLHRVGDALPTIRVDFGPVFMGAMFGAELEFRSDTGWTRAYVNDHWSNAPEWAIHDDNHWWTRLRQLMEHVSKNAVGRYLVCTPDLGGSGDVLLNLRGSAQLCLDMIDQPQHIFDAIDAIFIAWRRAFIALYDCAVKEGAGLVHWLGLWSNRPYVVLACDLNAMIGPREFEVFFLPDIIRQAATVGRAVFHLDGPGAARHVDALLDVPNNQAIQYNPGTGTPSALPWVDMFQRIQQRGRSLAVVCPADEVIALCEALRPEGLAILIETPLTPAELDARFGQLCQRYM